MSFVSLICTILTLVASWMVYKKMGRQGWEGIVPIYNLYVLCQELYGSGWKFLLLLIPLFCQGLRYRYCGFTDFILVRIFHILRIMRRNFHPRNTKPMPRRTMAIPQQCHG